MATRRQKVRWVCKHAQRMHQLGMLMMVAEVGPEQGATGPQYPPGQPRREVQPRRGAGGEFQICLGR